MRAFGWRSLASLTAAVLLSSLFLVYDLWRQGYPFHIPGIGTVSRFPCSAYRYSRSGYSGVIEAFAVIDGAALAASSNDKSAVIALVDVVFDRLLPMTRCGNPLRERVADGEMRFRLGRQLPISERAWSDAANDLLDAAGSSAGHGAPIGSGRWVALRSSLPRNEPSGRDPTGQGRAPGAPGSLLIACPHSRMELAREHSVTWAPVAPRRRTARSRRHPHQGASSPELVGLVRSLAGPYTGERSPCSF